jgi:hypothetical protein
MATFGRNASVGVDPRQLSLLFEATDDAPPDPLPQLHAVSPRARKRMPGPAVQFQLDLFPASRRRGKRKTAKPARRKATACSASAAKAEQFTTAELAEKAADIEYLADHAFQFLDYILSRNLEFIQARGSPLDKKSAIEWVMAPDVDGFVYDWRHSGEGRKVLVHQYRIPFTFQWVCRALGLSADEIRAGVARFINDEQVRLPEQVRNVPATGEAQ